MSTFFFILMFMSLVGLLVGLVNPKWAKMESRKKVFYWFGGAFVIFFILGGVTSPATPSVPPKEKSVISNPATTSQPIATQPVATPPTVDKPIVQGVVFPIEITSSKIENNSVGTPILYITVKNTGKKTIDAVTTMSYFFNNFDDPVGEWGAKESSPFAGIIQEKIAPNGTYSAQYNLAVYDTATKVKAEIYKVHFTDGTTISQE